MASRKVIGGSTTTGGPEYALFRAVGRVMTRPGRRSESCAMSLGLILIIILIVVLLGALTRRFGGHGYGLGHSGTGLIGVILVIVLVLFLLGKL
jgi:hypothetical protein